MRRTAALAIGLFVAGGCSRAPAVTQPTPSVAQPQATVASSPTPDPGDFDVSKAMDHVRALAVEIGYRLSGSEGDARAAEYVEGRLAEFGWTIERRAFPLPQGGESWNVIGTPSGFSENSPYLIVGGHYDSRNGPGANDNATGVAATLEIARALLERPASLPVMVIGFGAEERQPVPEVRHHVGSRWFVDHMSVAARRNLVAMVNVDMIGHGSPLLCGRMSTGPRDGTYRCLRIAAELAIPARERVTPDWSDNGSFLRAGMNAAWLWTGDLPCCYHNPRDTIDVVRAQDFERSGRVALAILRSYSR
jgi:aminopeptidase S